MLIHSFSAYTIAKIHPFVNAFGSIIVIFSILEPIRIVSGSISCSIIRPSNTKRTLYYNSIEDRTEYDVMIHSMLIGGIIGNMIDRIIHGYVIDFLSFNIFGYNFPVFNLADTFIVLSIILLIARVIKEDVWN